MTKITLINKKDKSSFNTLNLRDFLRDRQRFLKIMHINELWLKCHCVERGAIAFVKRNRSNFVLVNHAIEGKHHYRCCLYTDISGEINLNEQLPQSSSTPPKIFTPLKLNYTSSDKADILIKNNIKSKRLKTDRIHSLLCYALTEKYLNTVNLNKQPNLNALFYSKMFSLPVTSNNNYTIKVSDITFLLPNEKAREYQRIVENMKFKFSEEVPLQSNFIFVVDDLNFNETDKSFSYLQNEMSRVIKPIRQVHHYQRTAGPRIVFLIKALIEGEWQNYLAYSHPIVSKKHPILVDSSLERKFVHLFLIHASGSAMLTKPYLSTEYQGNQLLPDFIYKNKHDEQCLIEVMGLVDQEAYRERKARLVPLMSKRFNMPVLELTPTNLEVKSIELFMDKI